MDALNLSVGERVAIEEGIKLYIESFISFKEKRFPGDEKPVSVILESIDRHIADGKAALKKVEDYNRGRTD